MLEDVSFEKTYKQQELGLHRFQIEPQSGKEKMQEKLGMDFASAMHHMGTQSTNGQPQKVSPAPARTPFCVIKVWRPYRVGDVPASKRYRKRACSSPLSITTQLTASCQHIW